MEYLHQAFAFSRGMQGRQICHCEGRLRPWQSRAGTADPYWLPLKWHVPIASVAALTAQPLAALPLYGCGVPFTGGERHAGWHYLRHKFIGARPPQVCHSEERSDVGISCSRLRFRRGLPAIQHGTARLPRRLRLLAMTNPGASAFHFKFLYTTSSVRYTSIKHAEGCT